MEEGRHTLPLDPALAGELADGTYYCRVTTGDGVATVPIAKLGR